MADDNLRMIYRNWRGEVSEREICPRGLRFGSTDWHPEPGWLLDSFDVTKGEYRDFALADCDFRRADAGRVAQLEKAVDDYRARIAELEAEVARARRAERDRIIGSLEIEADLTACDEDAKVIRDCALLIRADFSYAEAAARRALTTGDETDGA